MPDHYTYYIHLLKKLSEKVNSSRKNAHRASIQRTIKPVCALHNGNETLKINVLNSIMWEVCKIFVQIGSDLALHPDLWYGPFGCILPNCRLNLESVPIYIYKLLGFD